MPSYSPEIIEAAMRMWAQANGAIGWSELARRINDRFGVKVAANTVKGWYERGVPVSWQEFLARYQAHLYESQAKRLAEEAAEVREHTWIALRSMFQILSKEVQQYAEGELKLKWRSADALFQAYLNVVKEYYRIFGDNSKAIEEIVRQMPEEARAALKRELEAEGGAVAEA